MGRPRQSSGMSKSSSVLRTKIPVVCMELSSAAFRSTRRIRSPRLPSRRAHCKPANPAPMMIASYASMLFWRCTFQNPSSSNTRSKSFILQSNRAKKGGGLAFAHLLDERFHMAEVTLQSSTTRGSEFVFGFWQPAFEIFRTRDISGFFEVARVDAEIAIGCIQQALKITEAQSFIRSECA